MNRGLGPQEVLRRPWMRKSILTAIKDNITRMLFTGKLQGHCAQDIVLIIKELSFKIHVFIPFLNKVAVNKIGSTHN